MGNRWKETLGLMISRRTVIIGSIVKTVDQPWLTRKWLLVRISGRIIDFSYLDFIKMSESPYLSSSLRRNQRIDAVF